MVEERPAGRLRLFGADLDPTDDELKLVFKAILARRRAACELRFRNPYEALTDSLRDLIGRGLCEASGEIDVPSWLTPAPDLSDLPLLTRENHLRFIDEGGCREVAGRLRPFVEAGSPAGIPAMIAVDHSMTGGALGALSAVYGPSNMTVLVVDSHFDGLGLSERIDLFRYGQEGAEDGSREESMGPWAGGEGEDASGEETYTCATWLKCLLDEKVIEPEGLILFGVSDYPTDAMRRNPFLHRYVGAYRAFEEAGVTFVTREEVRRKGVRAALGPLLKGSAADRLYISLDADIGSLDAVHAARFMNVVGLGRQELYETARVLEEALRDRECIGLDVCGIETFLLGRTFPNGVKDRTLEGLSDFIRVLLGQEPVHSEGGDLS